MPHAFNNDTESLLRKKAESMPRKINVTESRPSKIAPSIPQYTHPVRPIRIDDTVNVQHP